MLASTIQGMLEAEMDDQLGYKRQHSNKGNCFCKKSLQIIIHFVFLQIKNYFLCNLWKHSSRIGEWNLELLYIEAQKGHKKRPLYSDQNYKSYVIHVVLT